MIQAQEVANGPFQEFKLSFPMLVPPPMKYERQEYLYKYIRPFVRDEFKDATCPKPVGNINEN